MEFGELVVKFPAPSHWLILIFDPVSGVKIEAFNAPVSGCFISPTNYFNVGRTFPNGAPGCFASLDLHTRIACQVSVLFDNETRLDWVKWQTRWLKFQPSCAYEHGILMLDIEGRLRDNSLVRRNLRVHFMEREDDTETLERVEPRAIAEHTIVWVKNLSDRQVLKIVGHINQHAFLHLRPDADGSETLYFSSIDAGEQASGFFNPRPQMVFSNEHGVIWEIHKHNGPVILNIPIAQCLRTH